MSDVFTLSVRLEGAAFTGAPEAELAAIVRSVADTVADVGSLPSLTGAETKVFDANGNSCGTWSVQPERHDVRRWLAAALGHSLRTAGLPDPQVNVRQVTDIARHPETGKARRFVPL